MQNTNLEELLEQYALKDQVRTGWEIRGVSSPESVAAHSWGTAFLCLRYAADAGVDLTRCLSMAIIHDIAEAVTGDVARRVNSSIQTVSTTEKRRREREIMERYGNDSPDLIATWSEYEECATPEARFVRDMNLLDMCLQALLYERNGRYDEKATAESFAGFAGMSEFFATSGPRFSTEVGKRLYNVVHHAYRDVRRTAP